MPYIPELKGHTGITLEYPNATVRDITSPVCKNTVGQDTSVPVNRVAPSDFGQVVISNIGSHRLGEAR